MKLSGTQLFVVALVALAILSGVAYFDRTYVPVLVSVLLAVLAVFTHINGLNIGVPLSPQPTALPATLESTQGAPVAAASTVALNTGVPQA